MPKIAFQKISELVLILLRNICPHVKFFFTSRCADDTESIDIETTGHFSSLCVINFSHISGRMRSLCAGAGDRLCPLPDFLDSSKTTADTPTQNLQYLKSGVNWTSDIKSKKTALVCLL